MTNTIYNTSTTAVVSESFKQRVSQPEPPLHLIPNEYKGKVSHSGWHLEEMNPLTDLDNWWGSGLGSLDNLCSWAGSTDFYKWSYDNVSRLRFGAGYPSQLCFETICKRVLPHFFGIYSINGSVIQVNLRDLLEKKVLKFRKLTLTELSNYFFYEISYIEKKLSSSARLAREIFTTKSWRSGAKHRWFPNFTSQDALFSIPPLVETSEGYGLYLFKQNECGELKVSLGFVGVKWSNEPDDEYNVIEFFKNMVGQKLTKEELEAYLDSLNFRKDANDKRVKLLNQVLFTELLRVVRKRTRRNNKLVTLYEIQSGAVVSVETKTAKKPISDTLY